MRLERLAAEPFGAKLRRAREARRLQTREVAQIVSRVVMVSHATIARLEKELNAPTDRRRRSVAVLCALLYGIEPEDFGLSLEDLPPLLDGRRIGEQLRQTAASSQSR